jgi:hypothetical protein
VFFAKILAAGRPLTTNFFLFPVQHLPRPPLSPPRNDGKLWLAPKTQHPEKWPARTGL